MNLLSITQFFLRRLLPSYYGLLTRIIYSGKQISIGKNFKTDSIPRIVIDINANLKIGNNVEFKRNVEIRCHKNSTIKIESFVRIDRGVRILSNNEAEVTLSENVRIGLYSVLNGGDSIRIGRKSLISGFVYLQTSMHTHNSRQSAVQDQGYFHAPIVIGDDTWLGTHVVIMPGITLNEGVVVGSNSVVTKNVNAYNVVAGVPAKIIKERQ